MLNTYLKATPPSKFVLINDCLQEKGFPLINFLNEHHQKLNNEVKCFVFEGNFVKARSALSALKITSYDFTKNRDDVEETFRAQLTQNTVIIIDSLVHLIYSCGLVRTCNLLSSLAREMNDNQQIIAILHLDLLRNSKRTVQFLEHLATLSLTFEPSISRVNYTYKKVGGRVFKQIESYKFQQGQFITEEIKKQNVQELIQEKINEVCPENLSTFKIELSEADKESRDNLTLPYLPKEVDSTEGIIYNFDEEDDWDEEDPDDDLDL
ncbi:elongator complex protein 5 [Coccinella septempunctata]|uniref:elongator complex protein 5 n=1 Tax=Coccinella septempunctata TaxID=41139 RepID=UPI001D092AEA|nr:elongator complex protein 5 [Coccinella septempunctata]